MKDNLTWGKVSVGSIAGIVTLGVLGLDRLDFLSTVYSGATSWTVLFTMLFFICALSFIGGLRREYTVCLTYIASMALYDLVTNDFQTMLFAGISAITTILGAVASVIVRWVSDPI